MDIKAELEANRKKLQDIARQINQLKAQEQELLQEMLRCDGEARLLAKMDGGKKNERP